MENNRAQPAAVLIGRRLKEAREKKALTIEQIQKQTKIHSTVLRALEEGRASEMLTDTYVRSFLKKYAQVLDISQSEVLKDYFPPRVEPAVISAPAGESPMPEETKKVPRALYFTAFMVLGIAALLITIMIVGKIAASFNKAILAYHQRQSSLPAASKNKASKSAKPAQKKKVSQKTDPGSKEIIPRSEKLDLVITVKEPVLVTATKDDIQIFSNIMTQGIAKRITANKSIELKINKIRALELTLNGRRVDLPAKDGILDLVITRKGVILK